MSVVIDGVRVKGKKRGEGQRRGGKRTGEGKWGEEGREEREERVEGRVTEVQRRDGEEKRRSLRRQTQSILRYATLYNTLFTLS
jgi:hypothetical protein